MINNKLFLDGRSVQVNFTFTNPAFMPEVPERVYLGQVAEDARHAAAAIAVGEPEKAEVGRHREGRVDTGEPVFENIQAVDCVKFISRFSRHGYRIVACTRFEKPGRNKPKYVFRLQFRPTEQSDEPAVSPEAEQAMRQLGQDLWVLHIWDNGEKGITLNFVARTPGPGRPGHQEGTQAKHRICYDPEEGTISIKPL